MKKSNVIVFAILLVISIFLLWLWYFLGLNHVDDPLDLVLSIVWWVLIVVAIVVIVQVEKARRKRIRTIYVSDDIVFNSEAGSQTFEGTDELLQVMEKLLHDLKYDFTKNDLPNTNAFPIRLIVRTNEFGDDKWKGEVVTVKTKQESEFNSKDELYRLLADSQ